MNISHRFFFLLFFSGCIHVEDLSQRLSTWKGSSEDQVLMTYGIPIREKITDTGLKIYTFDTQSIESHVNYHSRTGNMVYGGSYSLSCEVTFFLKNGVVEKSQYMGDWEKCHTFVRGKN